MDTPTLISIFFALCGVGILLSLAAPASRQGNVLAWLGCLASIALVLAGANALLAGKTFSEPLWSLPGLAATLTLKMDSLSAVFHFRHRLGAFSGFNFCGRRIEPRRFENNSRIQQPRCLRCSCSDFMRPSP